jgi:predicted SAM-dependent methyltransferase
MVEKTIDAEGKVLHLGCGETGKQDGMINVDIRNLPNVDVISDIRDMPFMDSSAGGITTRNAIEHFGRNEIKPLLNEWSRVLKKGGFLRVETVDMGELMDKWRQIPEENMLDGILGAQTYDENFHKMVFTKDILERFLKEAGFMIKEVNQFEAREIPRILIVAFKI